MKARLEESYSLVNTPVKDVDGKRFAKVADATVSKDFKVQEYDLSRSFFDDLDYGYSLVDAERMEYRDKSLNYDKDMLEMEQTHRSVSSSQYFCGPPFRGCSCHFLSPLFWPIS